MRSAALADTMPSHASTSDGQPVGGGGGGGAPIEDSEDDRLHRLSIDELRAELRRVEQADATVVAELRDLCAEEAAQPGAAPAGYTNTDAIAQFHAFAGTRDDALALAFLSGASFDVKVAVDHYFESDSAANEQESARALTDRIDRAHLMVSAEHDQYALLAQVDEWHECLKLARAQGHPSGRAILNHLGVAYCRLGEYHKAVEYHKEELAVFVDFGDRQGQGSSLGSLGDAYLYLDDYRTKQQCSGTHRR
jgi:tetratricopeptide (TPR) repeat protein